MPAVGTITYDGTSTTLFKNSPYSLWGILIPDYGGIPFQPQYVNEVLQPKNTDGARYRIGGSHFPVFQLVGIMPASDYAQAQVFARELEMLRADGIILTFQGQTKPVWVHEVKATASQAQIMGATAQPTNNGGGNAPPGGTASLSATASINLSMTLQVYLK